MNRILLFCALGALWGCRQAAELSGEAITLSCSTSESSKVGALTAGDAVAVFARIEGTETYFLEGEKFITGSDGKTLSRMPAVHYPETKQAVNFYAYFPYHTGSFSVPNDQSTAATLKKADLCWANASSTPVATPVSLQFSHLFARLIVSTNQTPSKIACQVVPSGTLNPATAQFNLNNTKSEVSTTGNELILPVQPLSRLVLTVANIEYVFEGSINLQAGQTTTLNLTLNPSAKTATLNGSSTTKWGNQTSAGVPDNPVTNLLTVAWLPPHPRAAEVDKLVLTINHDNTSVDYTLSSGITQANNSFVFAFASATLTYPYTIKQIRLYKGGELIQTTERITGGAVYKSGAYTVGVNGRPINPPREDQIFYFDGYGTPTYWTKGYLVAKAGSVYECMVGTETDMGLYFQFGSLIGWCGAKTADGTGAITDYTQALPTARRVHPIECNTPPTTLSGSAYADLDHFYFGLQSAPYNGYADIRAYPGFAVHQYAPKGVGDPCSYYLGEPWRLPTDVEQWALWRRPKGSSPKFVFATNYAWDGTSYIGSGGVRFYNTARTDNTKLMASGERVPNWFSGTSVGANLAIIEGGWACYTYDAIYSYVLFSAGPSYTYYYNGSVELKRSSASPIRCVHN